MSSSINPTPDLSFMSAAVGDNTDSSSSENGDRNNVFDQISANDDNASYKGEINGEINENSSEECITYTYTPVTRTLWQ